MDIRDVWDLEREVFGGTAITKLFISHASEDKDTIARPLADALIRSGFRVWYDEYSLSIGDSLKGCIDAGLQQADFGIVILSPAFFSKHWPREELDGLSAVETARDQKVVLPIWHDVSLEQVACYSPTLAGKVAIASSVGVEKIVEAITRSVNNSISFAGRNDLEVKTIHVASFAAETHLNLLKAPEVSWEEFGKELLRELRRLDEAQDH